MKKIFKSLFVLVAVSALAIAATSSFFSDTETSTGNVLRAGAIDLKIDNTSYYNGYSDDGSLEYMDDTSWTLRDLTNEVFFKFTDLKPGDLGEDTISIHVDDNPAWVCADIQLTGNNENGILEPEATAGDVTDDEGELAQYLNFIFWEDDGDNVLEVGEQVLTSGPASSVLDGARWAIADSQTGSGPLDPEGVRYIGKAFCFGDLSEDRVDQDNVGFEGAVGANGPDVRGAGVSCSGDGDHNMAQTDSIEGNVSFDAVQARHNENFTCNPPEIEFRLNEQSAGLGQNSNNQSKQRPYVNWSIDGECIDFTFVNPTPFSFAFDYRVDGETGDPDSWTTHNGTGLIPGGPLSGQLFGDVYNLVNPGSNGGTALRHVCGTDTIEVGLRRGAENDYYIDWIEFNAFNI